MGKVKKLPKARAVLTPGSRAAPSTPTGTKKRTAHSVTPRGRPKKVSKKAGLSRKDNYRSKYSSEDVTEAVRLVLEEGYSISRAALKLNFIKKNIVPRMTLSDRLRTKSPRKEPKVGRPLELPFGVEEAIVKCLKYCAEYQYPMRKKEKWAFATFKFIFFHHFLVVKIFGLQNSIHCKFILTLTPILFSFFVLASLLYCSLPVPVPIFLMLLSQQKVPVLTLIHLPVQVPVVTIPLQVVSFQVPNFKNRISSFWCKLTAQKKTLTQGGRTTFLPRIGFVAFATDGGMRSNSASRQTSRGAEQLLALQL